MWASKGSLNNSIILHPVPLDDYCRRLGEWSERPHIQVFMVLYHHYLCKGNVKINEETLDTMEVPLFYGPLVS